jgi:hypothetical protein
MFRRCIGEKSATGEKNRIGASRGLFLPEFENLPDL